MDAKETIENYIEAQEPWKRDLLSQIRATILSAAPGVKEEWKWNTPVWTLNKPFVAASAFKKHVKINFFRGADLKDSLGLFNSGHDAKTMRSIDLYEGNILDAGNLAGLIQEAAQLDAIGNK